MMGEEAEVPGSDVPGWGGEKPRFTPRRNSPCLVEGKLSLEKPPRICSGPEEEPSSQALGIWDHS